MRYIGSYAFEQCDSLKRVTIPKSVYIISERAFTNCGSLEEIIVEEGNSKYHVNKGCLIETVNNMVIATFGDYEIPNDLRSIGTWAFSGKSDLENITIPNGVYLIDKYAFANCSNLKSITIPRSVRIIEDYILLGCDSFTDIYFDGTISEWNTISKSWKFADYKSYTLHCTDGDYDQDGNIIE